jgi:SAM-dependent methyltransferase
MSDEREPAAVAERYARRTATDRYSVLKPDVWQTLQERQRALLALFARIGWSDLGSKRLLEVGCGGGANLLELLRVGFAPEHLSGVELLPDRHAQARRVLPEALALHGGDALQLDLPAASQDAVFVSTVFSSLLDDAFQQRLADAMWRWLAPGGGVLWYDFTMNNPRNPDVRGVPLKRVRQLFPHGIVQARRVTLAPPIARTVTRVHPSLYTLFNTVPMLRSHVLGWIAKP